MESIMESATCLSEKGSEHESHALPRVRRTIYTKYVKRALDVVLSGTAIVALSPLLVGLSGLELVFHGRPILFAQQRPGLHGELFNVYKFRSMTNGVDADGNLLPSEDRLTPFGEFIRRFSLDELPELFCILSGKMSIIGPRPLLPKYLPLYSERHMMRHEVRPGLACLSLEPIETWTWNDQFENDIWYVENCSFFTDVCMIITVAKEALLGSEYRVKDTRPEFNGNNLYDDAKEPINERAGVCATS